MAKGKTGAAVKAFKAPAKTPDQIRKAILELEEALSLQFVERDDHIRALLWALLAPHGGANVFFLGPPGVGKTNLINNLSQSILGKFFETTLFPGTMPEHIVGPMNVDDMMKGEYRHNTKGMLPDADIAMLDELPRANPGVLDQILPMLNERKFTNGSQVEQLRLLMVAGGANSLFEDENLDALWDRFAIRMWMDDIQDDDSWASIIFEDIDPAQPPTSDLSPCDILIARDDIAKVGHGNVRDFTVELRRKLKGDGGVNMSPRRWKAAVRIARVSAWLQSRTELEPEDFEVVSHIAWNTREEQRKIEKIVSKLANPWNDKALEWVDSASEIANAALAVTDSAQKVMSVARAASQLADMVQEIDTAIKANPGGRMNKVKDALVKVRSYHGRVGNEAARLMGRK